MIYGFRPVRFASLSITASLLACALAASLPAEANDFGRTPPEKPPGHPYQGGGRVGGDTVADAVPIPGIPFADTGSTCGFAHDYDEACPYTGSTSPDVVYSYTPAEDEALTIDLCASAYDTKVYVYAGSVGSLVACNDDAGCGYNGWQSRLTNVNLLARVIYYIVVDGYGGSCGDYVLEVEAYVPCEVPCPPGAQMEGEPPCHDLYVDTYNPGCSGPHGYPVDWTPIHGDAGGCGTMCGRSCTFDYQGLSYRDTDWYRVGAVGGPLTMTCTGEFPIQEILIYGANCGNLQYLIDHAGPCEPVTLEWNALPNHDVWLWVGPEVFDGVPESGYVLEVCGILPVPSVEGACCIGTACQMQNSVLCEFYHGDWGGPGVSCSPYPCGHTGACCLADGSCIVVTMTPCNDQGGRWLYPITSCDPDPCGPVPAEATSWGRIKAGYR